MTVKIYKPTKTSMQSGLAKTKLWLSEYISHQKDGYIVNANSAEIANSILDYFNNNREEFFSKELKKKLDFFSWKKLLDTFEKLYLSDK